MKIGTKWRFCHSGVRSVPSSSHRNSFDLPFRIVVFSDDFADAMRNFRNEGIAHTESAMSVCHSVVGPAFRETLELIQLVGNESSQTPVLYHHMLRAAGTSSAFSREDCTAGFVQRIGKSNGAFGIDVFMSVAGGALLVFTAF